MQSGIQNPEPVGAAIIRVLIVEDSPTMRMLIRAILESDTQLKVVGEARNGKEAIDLCQRLQPDIITMDTRMPVMDGYETVRHIMSEMPRPIVMLTGSMSGSQLKSTYKAIECGALMILKKPRDLPGKDVDADLLIAHLKAMAGVKVVSRRLPPVNEGPNSLKKNQHLRLTTEAVGIIAIGASTGGPPALYIILNQLPAGLPVPIVVVQHISPGFVGGLAQWLNDTTPLPVKVAQKGERLHPGIVYMAKENRHLMIRNGGHAWLTDSEPVDGHRPSVTALFQSVARHYGSSAVGVLLTGMGKDGARGLKDLHNAGAYTIAQDKTTSIVFGMPKEAIALGAAREVLPLEQIGDRLRRVVADRFLIAKQLN